MTNFSDEYVNRKPDMTFDYKNCGGYMPVEHHYGLCAEGSSIGDKCYTCPVHTDFALWELGEGVTCVEL